MTGTQLKALRKRLGLSLAGASRLVSVSPRSWARWGTADSSIPDGALHLFLILTGERTPQQISAKVRK